MSNKKQLLIDTALELFYNKGINSIGINEIIKTSGVAKRTLYTHFDSKEALILAALKQRHDIFMAWLAAKLVGAESNTEVIDAVFAALNGWFKGTEKSLTDFRGCFFINTSAEFSDNKCEISQYCSYHKKQVRELLKDHLDAGSSNLLDAMCIMIEGAIITAYMSGNSDEVTAKSADILKRLQVKRQKAST